MVYLVTRYVILGADNRHFLAGAKITDDADNADAFLPHVDADTADQLLQDGIIVEYVEPRVLTAAVELEQGDGATQDDAPPELVVQPEEQAIARPRRTKKEA